MTEQTPGRVLPVVFSSDEYFVPYMSALIQSIMDNAGRGTGPGGTKTRYRFYVLHRGIGAESRRLLEHQVEHRAPSPGASADTRFSVSFVDVASHLTGYRLSTGRLDLETWFRLLIPWLFEYEKVLYLDSDMICNTDLAELFDVDVKGFYLAACRDDFLAGDRGRWHARSIGFENHRDYFNAGMLLFNTEAFRNETRMDALLDLAASRDWDFSDQDVLNVFCRNRVKILGMEWNAMITMYNEDAWPPELRQEYRRSRRSPKIAHFAGPKPWDRPAGRFSRDDQLALFLRYSDRTPFSGIVRERIEKRKTAPRRGWW